MRNYYLELSRINPLYREKNINPNDEKIILKYKVVENSPYVEITYFNGYTDLRSIEEVSIDEIKMKQCSSFYEMCKDVKGEANDFFSSSLCFCFLMAVNSVAFCEINRPFAAIGSLVCTLPCCILWGSPVFRLVKEINDTRWIINNKDIVDKVISEDYDKAHTVKSNGDTLIPTKILSGELHYPEELYEDGITLNNVDLLSRKEIAKLKRKVMKRKEF